MPGSASSEGLLIPSIPEVYQSDDEPHARPPSHGKRRWFSRLFRWRSRDTDAVSGYQVIIRHGVNHFGTNTMSLSDPRLKPKLPKCFVALLVILCLGAVLSVYFLVPRGVVVDQVNISKDIMTKTLSTYTLVVDIGIPISNRNFLLPLEVSGNVTMYYYQKVAGSSLVPKTTVGVRSDDQVEVSVDASFVPMEYIAVVLRHCSYFPYELVFFLEGHLRLNTLFETRIVKLDSYSFIRCPDFG